MTEINTCLRKCPGAGNGEIKSKHSRLSVTQLSKANSPDNLLKVKVKSLSRVRLSATPWTIYIAHQGDSPGRNTGVGLPCPSPGDLPDPGIEHRSPVLWADTLPSEPPGKKKKRENKIKPPQQDKILRVPNCWKSAIQNNNGKSNPTILSGHRHQSTTDQCGRAWKKIPGNIHGQQSA